MRTPPTRVCQLKTGDWLKPMPLDTEEFEAFETEAQQGAMFAQAYGQVTMANYYAWPQVRVGEQQ